MKTRYKIQLITLLFFVSLAINAQGEQNKDRKKAEANTAAFSLNYFSKSKNSFYVLTLDVINTKIVLDKNAKITEVAGKLPYKSGDFTIKVMDNKGEVIKQILMLDPLLVRSCDKGENHLEYLKNGQIMIPLPKSSKIKNLIFLKGKKTIANVNISSLLTDLDNPQKGKK